jgi:hypothetical protein
MSQPRMSPRKNHQPTVLTDEDTQDGGIKAKQVWNPPQESLFLELMHLQAMGGKRAGNGFKKEAWTTVKNRFNTRMRCSLQVSQFKSKYFQLRDRYNMAIKMKGLSGWKWDHSINGPDAPEAVKNDFLDVRWTSSPL